MPDPRDLETNKALVQKFYREFLEECDFSNEAALVRPDYIQHSSWAEDGLEGVKKLAVQAEKDWPERKVTFVRTIAEGDLVVLHVHLERWPGDPGLVAIDIFRIEEGLLAEHWDSVQPVPETMPHGRSFYL